jgi:hypothetical protein
MEAEGLRLVEREGGALLAQTGRPGRAIRGVWDFCSNVFL